MADSKIVLLQGTLDLLILRTLSLGPNHGLAVARRVEPHCCRHGGGNRRNILKRMRCCVSQVS
jgi:DNA-binding PadR family transcriptional regulator